MRIDICDPQIPPPVDRAFVVSVVIKSFKGRRDVEVHLFRPADRAKAPHRYPWSQILGDPIEPGRDDKEGSKRVVLEAFTKPERDQLVEYLDQRYADRLLEIRSQALEFPIPLGLRPLSDIPEGKTVGFIRFEQVPNYPLPFPAHGYYDLSRHKPVVEE